MSVCNVNCSNKNEYGYCKSTACIYPQQFSGKIDASFNCEELPAIEPVRSIAIIGLNNLERGKDHIINIHVYDDGTISAIGENKHYRGEPFTCRELLFYRDPEDHKSECNKLERRNKLEDKQ